MTLEVTESVFIQRQRPRPRRAQRPQGPRGDARPRRLRHRLLVAQLPQAVPGRHRQDRPGVRRRPRTRHHQPHHRRARSSASPTSWTSASWPKASSRRRSTRRSATSAATRTRASTSCGPRPPRSWKPSWPAPRPTEPPHPLSGEAGLRIGSEPLNAPLSGSGDSVTSRGRATRPGAGARRRGWSRCRGRGRTTSRRAARSNSLCSTSSIRRRSPAGAGLADPAGEQAVAGEQVRGPVRVVVAQGDRARRVADQVDHRRACSAPTRDGVAVADAYVDRHRQCVGVGVAGHRGAPRWRRRRRAAPATWSACRWVVTTVGQPGVADQLEQPVSARRRRRSAAARRSRGSAAGRRCCSSGRPRAW